MTLRLHPHPEPTTPVIVSRYIDRPRCPAMRADGRQCTRSLFSGSPMDVVIEGRTVTVCRQHGLAAMDEDR